MSKRQNSIHLGQEKSVFDEEQVLNKPRSLSQPPLMAPKTGFFELRTWSKSGSNTPRILPVVDDSSKYELIDTGRSKPVSVPKKNKKDDNENTPSCSV